MKKPKPTIHLPIKVIWLRMIQSGVKQEEYREDKPYWGKQLMGKEAYEKWVASDRSYPPKLRPGLKSAILHYYRAEKQKVELLGLEHKRPNPKWCPPGTTGLWFALKLGRVIETQNLKD